jgi:hypothetical protein
LKQVQKSSNRLLQARIAVRLHHGDDLALLGRRRLARGLQHGAISTG